jgi:hypothetical protein
MSEAHRFLATVYKIWMMRHVDVPEDVSSALIAQMGKADKRPSDTTSRSDRRRGNTERKRWTITRGSETPQSSGKRAATRGEDNGGARANGTRPKYIPVTAIVNGRSARTTLVPAGGGRFRMQINTVLRKAAQVDAGDLVSVELRLDLASRELPVPPDLRDGLKAVAKAWKAFDALTPAHRRHIIEYFDSAKSLEARQRRLERTIDFLLERALLNPRRQAKRFRS